jgi:hypothetical protein
MGDDVADEVLAILIRHDFPIEDARLDEVDVTEHVGMARRALAQDPVHLMADDAYVRFLRFHRRLSY